jgi:hypothetical protein
MDSAVDQPDEYGEGEKKDGPDEKRGHRKNRQRAGPKRHHTAAPTSQGTDFVGETPQRLSYTNEPMYAAIGVPLGRRIPPRKRHSL